MTQSCRSHGARRKPYAYFETSPAACPSSHFQKQQLIFDITLCGQLGGPAFAADPTCAAASADNTTTCETYVAANPGAFSGVGWVLNSLKVFGATAPTPLG